MIKYREYAAIESWEGAVSLACLIIALFFGVSIGLLIARQTKNILTNSTQFERAKKSKEDLKKS